MGTAWSHLIDLISSAPPPEPCRMDPAVVEDLQRRIENEYCHQPPAPYAVSHPLDHRTEHCASNHRSAEFAAANRFAGKVADKVVDKGVDQFNDKVIDPLVDQAVNQIVGQAASQFADNMVNQVANQFVGQIAGGLFSLSKKSLHHLWASQPPAYAHKPVVRELASRQAGAQCRHRVEEVVTPPAPPPRHREVRLVPPPRPSRRVDQQHNRSNRPAYDTPSNRCASNVDLIHRWARDKHGVDMRNKINIVLVGSRGVGKSSLLNAMRRLRNDEVGASGVDVNEVLGEIAPYPLPGCDHLVLWDCPGGGTINHPGRSYFMDKCLYAFDYLLIMCINLTEFEIDLLKQALLYRRPCAIVRNKAGIDFESKRLDDPRGFGLLREKVAKEQLIIEHRQKIINDLRKASVQTEDPSMIFVINSRALVDERQTAFEEERLFSHVIGEIAESRGCRLRSAGNGQSATGGGGVKAMARKFSKHFN